MLQMINCEVKTKQTMFVPSLNCSFKIVDYLTTTGILEFILIGSVPKEAPAFKTQRGRDLSEIQ